MPDHLWIGFKFYANDDTALEREVPKDISETVFGEASFDHLAAKIEPSTALPSYDAERSDNFDSFDYSEVFDLYF